MYKKKRKPENVIGNKKCDSHKEKYPYSKICVFRSMDSLSDQQDNLKEKEKKKDRIKIF